MKRSHEASHEAIATLTAAVGSAVLLLGLSVAGAEDKDVAPAEEYKALAEEFQQAAYAFTKATTEEERKEPIARVDKLRLRFLDLAEKNARDAIALDALIQVVTEEIWLENNTSYAGGEQDSPEVRAIAILQRDYVQSEKLAEACRRQAYGFRKECETFLHTVLEMNPHREVRGLACLYLAQFQNGRLRRLDLVNNRPEMAGRYAGLFGQDYLEALQKQDRAKAVENVLALFEEAAGKYGDVKLPYGGTVGERAKAELFEIASTQGSTMSPYFFGWAAFRRPTSWGARAHHRQGPESARRGLWECSSHARVGSQRLPVADFRLGAGSWFMKTF